MSVLQYLPKLTHLSIYYNPNDDVKIKNISELSNPIKLNEEPVRNNPINEYTPKKTWYQTLLIKLRFQIVLPDYLS